jgi:hypothetical protein
MKRSKRSAHDVEMGAETGNKLKLVIWRIEHLVLCCVASSSHSFLTDSAHATAIAQHPCYL